MKQEEKKQIFVTRASLPPYEEYAGLIKELWDTHILTNMGHLHEELREKLRGYLQVSGLELFTNGHLALEMVLQAFELSGEVITTPFTFASTTHAIVRNGLIPVMCDIREEDCTLDPDRIEELITERTCAIVPVHVYGMICDHERIEAIAKKHGLKVIYDAAHAFGETEKGRSVASFGDASMFSFHATKAFNIIEGGCVCWNAERPELSWLGDRLYKLKNFGITGKESVEYVGGNAKLNEFCAAMGLCNLRHVDEWIAERKDAYERYMEDLSCVKGLRLIPHPADIRFNYAYMPVIFEGGRAVRDRVYEGLCSEGIFPRKYFYPCVNDFECYRDEPYMRATPVAKRMSESVLTLPLYPELSGEDIDRICGLLKKLM